MSYIFESFQELNNVDEEVNESFSQVDWEKLSATEQFAAEAALDEINEQNITDKEDIRDIVQSQCNNYNEANALDEYSDEEFFGEEADCSKVLNFVLSTLNLNEVYNTANAGNDPITLYVKYEAYSSYGEGGQVKEKEFIADTKLDALKELSKFMHVYLYPEEIEEDELTFEEGIEKLINTNGDGSDYIFSLKDSEGNVYIDEDYDIDE